MHFFGLYGTLMFMLGFGITLYLIVSKFFFEGSIVNKPAFYIALTTMILGTQFFLTGFIAELISRSAADRNNYLIEETFGLDTM
jgi:ABC-type thiamin/hydroxymethylpyrimidine transport system permease subunit